MAVILNVLTLLAAAYNVWEFIYKKRILKSLIILFYITVFAVTIIVAAMSIYVFIYDDNFDPLFTKKYLTLDVLKATALAVMYWTVGLSMFQLGISI